MYLSPPLHSYFDGEPVLIHLFGASAGAFLWKCLVGEPLRRLNQFSRIGRWVTLFMNEFTWSEGEPRGE